MDIKVITKFARVSPRKVRPALYGLRGQNAETALNMLQFINKKGARLAYNLLKSAIAAAKENDLESNTLFIKAITCNEGPRLKRRLIGSRGRAKPILKRMSHLTLVISDNITGEKKKNKVEKDKKDIITGISNVDSSRKKRNQRKRSALELPRR